MMDTGYNWAGKEERWDQDPESKLGPLKAFIEDLGRATGEKIPRFDPDDGGIRAEILFVQRDPGPTVRSTNFISRENYLYKKTDQTARNFDKANKEADLNRNRTISWNAVPWEVGDNGEEFTLALNRVKKNGWFFDLLDKLDNLKVVVLMGGAARRLAGEIKEKRPDLYLITDVNHPGGQGTTARMKRDPEVWDRLVNAICKAHDLADGEKG